ncbi:hypothetical protein A3C26_01765 [Candidatus Daviesbacteria bacterium RIFCSPHIGHO2_02_FULL_39_12]|uniref:Uncharacterized protein n=2 Tax=Candidatus Daviesiibacteriota TaxID=1752718 RepID=A0A1F5JAL0_9BACT|nr:MAG: hypothetical protein A3C26_01765 [Candidatus Daviesbacteria bacterium RIFCSPHIGHO2_02_FULL_39_12]OGE72701.1 MAG: hypothetical protein A3H40_00090 [Candidatus Daviesbacteria bacterium RIFCSPLOWO2_02_FULL_38_15]
MSSNAEGGHFNTDGAPRAGHESDILISGDADYPSDTSSTPTPTPSSAATPTPTPTPGQGAVLGAAATPTSTPAPAVLGAQAQQGEVLGAQALAPTGVFDQLIANLLKAAGIIISGLGLLGYAKGKWA